jgi:threonine dehydrogenase-like Zn-dependent dehydrogenase
VRNLVVIPEEMPENLAVLAEPFAVALHAVDLAGIRPGDRVAVVGPGSVGLLLVGALTGHDVTLIGRDEDAHSLERGTRVGATSTLKLSDIADDAEAMFDVVFEAAGHRSAVELSTRLAAKGGRIVLVGLPSQPSEIDTAELARREVRLIGSRGYDLSTWGPLPERLAAASGLAELVTHEFELEDIQEALGLVEDSSSVKVIVRPGHR